MGGGSKRAVRWYRSERWGGGGHIPVQLGFSFLCLMGWGVGAGEGWLPLLIEDKKFIYFYKSNIEPATVIVCQIDVAGRTFSLSPSKNIAAYLDFSNGFRKIV
jgi:hypothetical protein